MAIGTIQGRHTRVTIPLFAAGPDFNLSSHSQPIRALHIISGDLWAGAEAQAFTLLSALRKRGLDVHAVVMNEGELTRRLKANDITVTILDERRMSPVGILVALRRLMRSWRPDIVHTHRIKENVLGSLANRLALNVPSLRTVHGAPEHKATGIAQLHKRAFQWLDRWCARHLQERLIAVSSDLAVKLAVQLPREKIVVIENGVDVEAVRAQIKPVDFRTREPNATHIGIAGRLTPVKRMDIFLRTAQLLSHRSPERDWRFHVFGDGPLLTTLIAQAEMLGISGITTFHGHREDIIACLGGLDVLVLCSDHEGLPMIVLEAMAVGARIASHAVGGIPDALSGYSGAALVGTNDAEAYASNIGALLHPAELGSSVPSHLDEKFSTSSNASSVISLYLQLLRCSPATGGKVV